VSSVSESQIPSKNAENGLKIDP